MSRRRFPDWNCSRCSFRNFGSRAKCKNCSIGTRPNQNGSGRRNSNNNNARNNSFRNNNNSKKSDWNCNSCNFLNFKSRNACKNCGAAKVQQSGFNQIVNAVNSMVAVPNVLNNFVENVGIANASSASSKNRRKSKELLQRGGDWKCNKCAFVNYQDRMQCEKCKTSKEETNEKWFKTQFISDINENDDDAVATTKGNNRRNKKDKNKNQNNQKRGRRGSKNSVKSGGGGKRNKGQKDWFCSSCNYENRPSRKKCRKCDTAKPAQQPQAKEAEFQPGAADDNNENKEEKKENNNGAVYDIDEKIEFAKNSYAAVGSGGVVKEIKCNPELSEYSLLVKWNVGVSEGRGQNVLYP